MYIQQIAKDEKQNVHCRLSYEDSIKWLSWMNKKDESLLTAYSIADMGDWLESTGTADEKESMRFKTDIGLLKDKSWPEVYVKGKVMVYLDKKNGWSGLALMPCQFKEIEIGKEKKSTKKKDKKEKKEEASNISDLDKTLKLTMQKLMHKKLVYKNNDGVTCSLTFYKSGYLEISSNCSPLKKEYNYFNKYLFYTAGIEKQKVEDGEIELVGFQWFTLEGNEFFRNLFMVIPKLGFNPDGSPKFFTVTHGSEYGKSHGSLQKVVMEAQEINDISCDASNYKELAKCSLPKILEFCEVKDFEPLKSFQSRGIYKRGSGKTLFAYLFEDEVIGKNSFASISLKGCINKMNPIFGETPKYLNFDFKLFDSNETGTTNGDVKDLYKFASDINLSG